MGNKDKKQLSKLYVKYRTLGKKSNVAEFFRALIPEIIFRTTKLEGEPVTREMVSSVLK